MVSFRFARRHGSISNREISTDEKALVRRLDAFLLTFGCLSQGMHRILPPSYWCTNKPVIKYLDQQNINNAYVSGMEEDLHLDGNDLNLYVQHA